MARKTYNEQFKRDAVKLMTDKGYSLSKASDALGVSQATLSLWKKTLVPREENRELRMEREILKKAATFFAKEPR